MSVPIGLHEDHAEFGGGFEDQLAVAGGGGGIVEGDELIGDGAGARGEAGDAGVQTVGRAGAAFAAGLVEDFADGFEEFGGIFGDEADGFAVDEEAVFADDGFDGEVLAGREADELGDFEVDWTEAVEERDEAVGVAAADGEVGAAEGFPGSGMREVEFFVVNLAEELGVSGGAASGDSGESAALAEEAGEVGGFAGRCGDLRFVHLGLQNPGPDKLVRHGKIRFIETESVRRRDGPKNRTNLSGLVLSGPDRSSPPCFQSTTRRFGTGVPAEAEVLVRGLERVGYGYERFFYVGVTE
jgi:hypothetical protein